MENSKGEEILLGEESATGIPVGINDGTGKEVALIASKLKWRFVNIVECSLHIEDKSMIGKQFCGFGWL